MYLYTLYTGPILDRLAPVSSDWIFILVILFDNPLKSK